MGIFARGFTNSDTRRSMLPTVVLLDMNHQLITKQSSEQCVLLGQQRAIALLWSCSNALMNSHLFTCGMRSVMMSACLYHTCSQRAVVTAKSCCLLLHREGEVV